MTLLPWAQMSAEMNTDLNQRIVQTPEQALWYESPAKDIHRRPLDRTGAEVAKATSIVRYLPGSQFASHQHGGGEEILVLEGTFPTNTATTQWVLTYVTHPASPTAHREAETAKAHRG